MLKKIATLILLGGIGTGCNSGLTTDPMKEFSDNIKNAKPAPEITKPEEKKAIDKEALIITSPSFFQFNEGKESIIEVTGRVVKYKVDFELLVPEIDTELPGIKSTDYQVIDGVDGEKTLKITWTPPANILKTGEKFTTRTLTVMLVVHELGGVIVEQKEIDIHIFAKHMGITVTNLPSNISVKSGDVTSFNISVYDPDSAGGSAPKIVLSNPVGANKKSGVSYMNIKSVAADSSKPNHWNFLIEVDAKNHPNLFFTSENYFYGVQAISSLGNMSNTLDGGFIVKGSMVAVTASKSGSKELSQSSDEE